MYIVLECSRLPWKKRSNFNARERSVFEITPANLSSCDLLPIYTYARSIDYDDEDEKETKTKTKTRTMRESSVI